MQAHGRRRLLRGAVVVAAALVLAGTAAGAVLKWRLDDGVINACRAKLLLAHPALVERLEGLSLPHVERVTRRREFARPAAEE